MSNSRIAIAGRGVQLCALAEDDLALIHQWESDLSSLSLWSGNRFVQSEPEFRDTIANRLRGNLGVTLIVRNGGGQPAGMVYSYDQNTTDGHCYITEYIDRRYRNTGIGAKAALLFIDYLFTYFPLRKIYVDVYAYNVRSSSALLKGGFVVEGQFREHRYFRGGYHDLTRLALHREVFYRVNGSRLKRLLAETAGEQWRAPRKEQGD